MAKKDDDPIGIGLVGFGAVGRIHTLCYREIPHIYPENLPEIKLVAVCTSRSETAERAASLGGFEFGTSDLSAMLEREDVTVVDCSAPNFLHEGIVLQALKAGKHVYCEKPLALNVGEAGRMCEAAEKTGVRTGMTYNFRFIPALMRAKRMIDDGDLGEIYSFQAEYLHTGYQDPGKPMSWKLRQETAGGGSLIDLGSHLIDLVRHLLGEFRSIRAVTRTYIPKRPTAPGADQQEDVTVDDEAWLHAELVSGAFGSIVTSRFATGTLDDLNLEIYGRKGALSFRLMDANWLYWFDAAQPGGDLGGLQGWTRIETVQHYPGAAIPTPRSIIGWHRTHAENQYRFLKSLQEGTAPDPSFIDGLKAQVVLEAAYSSAQSGNWVSLSPS